MSDWRIMVGDCCETLRTLDAGSAQTCVTSPPYFGLRDYGHDGQIGLEPTPGEFVAALVAVFREVRRVLRDDGTVWLNLGDSYYSPIATQGRNENRSAVSTLSKRGASGRSPALDAQTSTTYRRDVPGLKAKDLIGIPWAVAFALRDDGWFLRAEVIWNKLNAMPDPARDRPWRAHETLFLLTKHSRYYCETRDPPARSVWSVAVAGFPGAHFATFPPKLIEPCILAGSRPGDVVLDPFAGSGTTGMVALRHDRSFIGCELSPEYVDLARDRIIADSPLLNTHAEAA